MHRKPGILKRMRILPGLVILAIPASLWSAPAASASTQTNTVACPANYSPVACENLQPGTPFDQWYSPNGWGDIQGFTTAESVQPGETVQLKVQSPVSYTVDLYRVGWYQGDGARLMPWGPTTVFPADEGSSKQAASCLTTPSVGLVDCGNWPTTVSITIPTNAVSGLYIAGLDQTDGNGYMPYPFVVRDDSSHSAVVVQTSDETWQAYNSYGGQNLYDGSGPAPDGRAYQVSYNRPFADGGDNGIFGSEYAMIAWLERNGYDVSYLSGLDVSTRPTDVANHKVFISDGHDEYWNQAQWNNVQAAEKSGTSLGFFSGNEVFWKTRLAPSIDSGAEANRTLICYKMTKLEFSPPDGIPDPSGQWTGTWMDPAAGAGTTPENALTGTMFSVNAYQESSITVPSTYSAMRLWRNTAVAKLAPGQTYTMQAGTLGYEWDSDYSNPTRPSGEIDLSSTTLAVNQLNLDYGNTFGNGTATHSLVEYRDPTSHALVFGTATVQWSWGLDTVHSDDATKEDPVMQQATVNVLADMGVQPQTLQSNLVPATQSTDTVGPTTVVTSPAPNGTVPVLKPVTVTGTAADTGGGVVARTEVSVDGGKTWNQATGLTSWTYTFTPTTIGPLQIMARAEDDSVNIGAVATVPLTIGPQQCPCTIWPVATAPTHADSGDGSSVELGTKFQVSSPGSVTGVRFYKSAANTGTHTGSLWSSSGQLLATGTFSNETASGWQTLNFASPVPVKPNTTYIASYHAPIGHYSADPGFFTSQGAGVAPIQAVQSNSGSNGGNGVYSYSSAAPTSSYNDTNYWVDAVFDTGYAPTTPPTVTAKSPASAATNVSITAPVSATFSQAIDTTTLNFTVTDPTGTPVSGTVGYNAATNTATFQPSGQLALNTTYSVSVNTSDLWGNAMTAPATWSFTTSAAAPTPNCPCSLWSTSTVPAHPASGDVNSLELGTKFTSSVSGTVTGVRFYKSSSNTGTHTGTLWSATGQQLATGTFTGESASGWQTLTFATPVAITANTTYVVSYHTTTGNYSADPGYFANTYFSYPLSASGGSNGVYAYAASTTFPTGSYNSTNYWVDVVFSASGGNGGAAVSNSAIAKSAAAKTNAPTTNGAPAAAVAAEGLVTKSASEGADPVMDATHPITSVLPPDVAPASVRMTVVTSGLVDGQEWPVGTAMPGRTSYDAASHTVSFYPSAPLIRSGSYRVQVTATTVGNSALQPIVWTIRPSGSFSRTPPHSPNTGVAPGSLPASPTDNRKRLTKTR